MMMRFPTDLPAILDRIQAIDPLKYGQTRNFKNGAVTHLSPYISRGVISTKQVFEHILSRNLPWKNVQKLIQELAWRDYWQQVWIVKKEAINKDLKQSQIPVTNQKVPTALVEGTTGIEAMDEAIAKLIQTGYMHNHMRMYLASVACNIAQSHWLKPAQWMYSYLLDGDWASNALSWQWVAGANANKKYYANQANINKYFNSNQKGTFLDVEYKQFPTLPIPENLMALSDFACQTILPKTKTPTLKLEQKTVLYNYYNVDANWYKNEAVNRVLLLEPTFFKQYPVSQKCVDFVLALSKNIPDIQIFVGAFNDLMQLEGVGEIVYKEHPTNKHYVGTEAPRDWMFEVFGYFPSFFSFWKRCKKQIQF